MEPVTVVCDGACTVTHVISINTPYFALTLAEGGQIAGAILAVWVVGWAVRTAIRTLRDTDGNSSTSESES